MSSRVMYGAGPDGKGWWIQGGRNHELEALAADLLQKLFDREEEHQDQIVELKNRHEAAQVLLARAKAAIDAAPHPWDCLSTAWQQDTMVPSGLRCDCWKSRALSGTSNNQDA